MLKLPGCKSEPLAHYLKALGILRLVVEQGLDPKAKGHWQGNCFVLTTSITEKQLLDFFLYSYAPTPIISPWNGGSGFYEKVGNKRKILDNITSSTHVRFAEYKQSIETGDRVICSLEITKEQAQKDKAKKRGLVERLRENLSDLALAWLDTAACLTGDELKHAPLLGTGGNDGNLEFSKVFMGQIQSVLNCVSGEPTSIATNLLKVALFNEVISDLKFSGASGQFNPLAGGGYNAAPGFDSASRTNPWDYILMLEGSMLFVAGVTRKHENQQGDFVYPFTVRPAKSGYGSASDLDADRGELWIPIWRKPAALTELKMLFSEGRVKVQRQSGFRTAKDAVDFALALSQQGTRRGIDEFVRYGFQERNGQSYLAVPLGRFQPKINPQANLLGEVDRFRDKLKRVAQGKNCPSSIQRVHRQLDKSIIEFAGANGRLLDVLISLGAAEQALGKSRSSLWDEKFSGWSIQPLSLPSCQWVSECDDDSVEFRLALSLASCHLRQRLGYVRAGKWLPIGQDDRVTTWQQGSLKHNLLRWLQRESIEDDKREKNEADQQQSQRSSSNTVYYASLADIMQWISGDVDEEKLESIARGLALTTIIPAHQGQIKASDAAKADVIPIAYGLLKLVHHRDIKQEIWLKKEPSILPLLAAGDSLRATQQAIRRLKISGLPPLIAHSIDDPQIERIAAALAFPISDYSIDRLLYKFCQPFQENLEDE
jgi:CRISPR-associated protein Csx17